MVTPLSIILLNRVKHDMHIEPKAYKPNFRKIGSSIWYQSLVWWEVVGWSLCFPFACLEVQKRLFVSVCFPPHPSTRPYMREGVKHDMHIELKYCKFKLLGKLVVQHTKNK